MDSLKTIAFLILSGIFLGGCNTTRGIGQDIEATGEAIEEVAEETQEAMRTD